MTLVQIFNRLALAGERLAAVKPDAPKVGKKKKKKNRSSKARAARRAEHELAEAAAREEERDEQAQPGAGSTCRPGLPARRRPRRDQDDEDMGGKCT